MQTKTSGLTLIEFLVLIIIFVILFFYLSPFIFKKHITTEPEFLANETIQYLNSAYKLCKFEALGGNANCNTVNDLINQLNYEYIYPEKKLVKLFNSAEIQYEPKDFLKDGSSFAIKLPKTKDTFTIYLTKKELFTSKQPKNSEYKGGITIKPTIQTIY